MAISFRRWLLGKLGAGSGTEVICTELAQALEEYRLRELAFHTCISMIANAVGRCEFKTCKGGEEYRGREYYLWNIEPNLGQNSTAFLHKLVYKLYSENEALVVDPWRQERHFVADSWQAPEEAPGKLREYRDVAIGGTICASPLPERDVLHFRLQHKNIKPALDGLCQAYSRLVQAAMKNYGWASGRHMKVHVDQIAQGGDGWRERLERGVCGDAGGADQAVPDRRKRDTAGIYRLPVYGNGRKPGRKPHNARYPRPCR